MELNKKLKHRRNLLWNYSTSLNSTLCKANHEYITLCNVNHDGKYVYWSCTTVTRVLRVESSMRHFTYREYISETRRYAHTPHTFVCIKQSEIVYRTCEKSIKIRATVVLGISIFLPWSHLSPVYPVSHPLVQRPVMWSQGSTVPKQWIPQVWSHPDPYLPGPHAGEYAVFQKHFDLMKHTLTFFSFRSAWTC